MDIYMVRWGLSIIAWYMYNKQVNFHIISLFKSLPVLVFFNSFPFLGHLKTSNDSLLKPLVKFEWKLITMMTLWWGSKFILKKDIMITVVLNCWNMYKKYDVQMAVKALGLLFMSRAWIIVISIWTCNFES